MSDTIRDALGAVRCLREHPDVAGPARAALDRAAEAIAAAQADPLELPAAQAELEAAAFACPWGSAVLVAAKVRLGGEEVPPNRPAPPFHER